MNNSQIKQLEIERAAIKRENDKQKLAQLNEEIEALKAESDVMRKKWSSEKEQINAIQQNKIEIEQLKYEAERAEREGDYGRVAEIRYGKIKAAEQAIETAKIRLAELQQGHAMIKEEIDADDIADIVSRWTGIPVRKMPISIVEYLIYHSNNLVACSRCIIPVRQFAQPKTGLKSFAEEFPFIHITSINTIHLLSDR